MTATSGGSALATASDTTPTTPGPDWTRLSVPASSLAASGCGTSPLNTSCLILDSRVLADTTKIASASHCIAAESSLPITRMMVSPPSQVLVLPLNTPLTLSLVNLAVAFLALRTTTNPASARPVTSTSTHAQHSAARIGRRCMTTSLERERGLGEHVAMVLLDVGGGLDLDR